MAVPSFASESVPRRSKPQLWPAVTASMDSDLADYVAVRCWDCRRMLQLGHGQNISQA